MYIIYIFQIIVLIFVAMFITTLPSLYVLAFFTLFGYVTGSNQRIYPLEDTWLDPVT